MGRYSTLFLSIFFVIGFAFIPPLDAQISSAEITGIVADASGAPIPNANVTITNIDTGVTRTVNSEADGRYRLSPLDPGKYRLSVHASNFQTADVENLIINLGVQITQNVSLRVGSTQQTVEVTAAVPIIDLSSQTVSGVIDQRQITTLPVNTRQYLNLALLEPGTTQDASRSFYNNVQVGGGDYYYANGFMIDGVRNTWAEQGEPRQNFPEGAVQEFKVYVTQFPADFGLYMGGLVTVATKNGTNKLHGEFFEYWRNEALNRDNRFQQAAEASQGSTNPFNRNQFGADFGGPIVKDRTHYYLAYERTQQSASFTIFTLQPQFYNNVQGTFRQPSYDQMVTARVDHQISNTQSLFVRYGQEWNRLTYQGCGGASERNCYDGLIPRHALVVGHTWNPSASTVNEARFQYAYASFQLGPPGAVWRDANTLATSPSATATLQTGYVFPSLSYGFGYQEDGVEKRWEGSDTLSVQKGSHTLHFGADINYVPFIDATASNLQGTYTFGTDQSFNPYSPASLASLKGATVYTASIPAIATTVNTWELGFFASDEWKIRPGLTLNLGIRYDRELGSFNEQLTANSFPRTIPYLGNPQTRGDTNNFAPRFGFAWDPFGKGRDVFRGGYGIYYNNIQTLQNFGEARNLALCSITIRNPVYLNPYNGQSASNFCSTSPPNVTVLAPDYVNPYSQQMNLGYSHQFTTDLALKVNGVYEHILRDFRIVDLNYPNANGIRPLTAWGQINQRQPTAQAKYKALFVELDKRFSRRFQSTVAYTLSGAKDNAPQAAIVNYANPYLNWGPSNIDRRHALVASASVDLPWKFTLGFIWTVRSSLPFNAFSTTTNLDGTTQYVPGTSRNQGNRTLNLASINAYRTGLGLASISSVQKNTYNSFDIHFSRSFAFKERSHFEIIAQCFNLFGHENLLGSSYVTSAVSSSFGTMTSASNLQQAELAARFVF